MRHPFAGVIKPEEKAIDRQSEPAAFVPTRRGLFGLVAGALAAGTFGLLGSSSKVEAQNVTTLALGEEGARRRPIISTRAFGEEGGLRPTTRAFGEEGGRRPRRRGLKK